MTERPLTSLQKECLLAAEDTLFGDTKLTSGHWRSIHGLKLRGLIDGEGEHVYLSDSGKAELAKLA